MLGDTSGSKDTTAKVADAKDATNDGVLDGVGDGDFVAADDGINDYMDIDHVQGTNNYICFSLSC
jgi:hypothetical protein